MILPRRCPHILKTKFSTSIHRAGRQAGRRTKKMHVAAIEPFDSALI